MVLKSNINEAELPVNLKMLELYSSLERLNSLYASWDSVDMDRLLEELETIRTETASSPTKLVLDQDRSILSEIESAPDTVITQDCIRKDPTLFSTNFEVIPETGFIQDI